VVFARPDRSICWPGDSASTESGHHVAIWGGKFVSRVQLLAIDAGGRQNYIILLAVLISGGLDLDAGYGRDLSLTPLGLLLLKLLLAKLSLRRGHIRL